MCSKPADGRAITPVKTKLPGTCEENLMPSARCLTYSETSSGDAKPREFSCKRIDDFVVAKAPKNLTDQQNLKYAPHQDSLRTMPDIF